MGKNISKKNEEKLKASLAKQVKNDAKSNNRPVKKPGKSAQAN